MKGGQYFKIFLSVVILTLLFIWLRPSEKLKLILSEGHVSFLKQGWFRNEEYPIMVVNGKWCWKLLGDFDWREISTPYEGNFSNDVDWIIVLENNGRIYEVKKDKRERNELKVLDGCWHRHVGNKWLQLSYEGEFDN